MSKRILIHATPAGEVWATFVENGVLEELFVESTRKQVMRGNIYRAHITSIDNKLRAAFIDYGTERNGFISIKDIHPSAYHRVPKSEKNFLVSEVLQVGQPLLVQLKKEEDGTKGAAFTTDITLASSYTVISPVSGGEFTISRKITNAKVKRALKAMMKQCDPDNRYGVMLRTASEGREAHEVLADLQTQLRAWGFIQADFQTKSTPCILYKESQLITRMVRDHFTDDVDEIILDDEESFDELKRYCEERMPSAVSKLTLYDDRLPLFVRYKVESQINQLTTHQLDLPSGGNISVNHTEAATVFDINSSRQSGGGDQQQMFLVTNCEAAELIARQVRLRGIGGLIFIDFINMREMRHRRQVEKVFKEAVKRDRAHLEVGMISRFCVLEISRNRIQERSLSTTHTSCPTCSGSGYIPSPNVVAFKLINSLYALAERIGPGRAIKGKLPVAHAMYLLNEKRMVLVDLEERYGVTIEIEADFTQSLLAPDPFIEGGRAQREPSSKTGEGRRESRRRERRDSKKSSGQSATPASAPRSKLRSEKPPRAAQREQVSAESKKTTTQAPAQIIGFIPKEQLDRAEAASLLSQQGASQGGFEGRPARGFAQDNTIDEPIETSDRTEEDSKRRRRRRRRGRKDRDRSEQQSSSQRDERGAQQSPSAQPAQDRSQTSSSERRTKQRRERRDEERKDQPALAQITAPLNEDQPELDERARRRAEARERNRARSNRRKGRGRHDTTAVESNDSRTPRRDEQNDTPRASEGDSSERRGRRRSRKGTSSTTSSETMTATAPREVSRRERSDAEMSESKVQTKSTSQAVEASEQSDQPRRSKAKSTKAQRPPRANSTTPQEESRVSSTEAPSSQPLSEGQVASSSSAPDAKATTKKAATKKAATKKAATKKAATKKAATKKAATKKAATKKAATKKAATKKVVTAQPATNETPQQAVAQEASGDEVTTKRATKAATKKAATKKAATKKATTKKAATKKAVTKKAATKKAATKKATAKKAATKKAATKKTATKKAATKKAATKKATAKKATAKKAATKKTATKKAATKKATSASARLKAEAAALLDRLEREGSID